MGEEYDSVAALGSRGGQLFCHRSLTEQPSFTGALLDLRRLVETAGSQGGSVVSGEYHTQKYVVLGPVESGVREITALYSP